MIGSEDSTIGSDAVMRPLIDMKAVEKVEAHIAAAVKRAPRSKWAAGAQHSVAAFSSRRY
jgi:hypothetical protein